MRKLSLSLIALALLSLAPTSDAQQVAPGRKSVQAKSHKSMVNNEAKAKSLARFHAWQKTLNKSPRTAPANSQQMVRFQNWKQSINQSKGRHINLKSQPAGTKQAGALRASKNVKLAPKAKLKGKKVSNGLQAKLKAKKVADRQAKLKAKKVANKQMSKLKAKKVANKQMAKLKAKKVSSKQMAKQKAKKVASKGKAKLKATKVASKGKAKFKAMKAKKVSTHSLTPAQKLKAEYGKRYKIKQAVKSAIKNRQQALAVGQPAMATKLR